MKVGKYTSTILSAGACGLIALLFIQLLGGLISMSDSRTSQDAQQGIPAINDPAAVDQDQYGKMAQGAGVGAGSGAALGGAATSERFTCIASATACDWISCRHASMHIVLPSQMSRSCSTCICSSHMP